MSVRLGKSASMDIPPEGHLLLGCARIHFDVDESHRIRRLVEQGLDWSLVRQLAAQHAITPLLHDGLTKACPDAIPVDVLKEVTQDAQKVTQSNERNLDTVLTLLSLFEDNKIPVVPFKGVALALSAYGDLSRRMCGDIDLLVRRVDFWRAKDLLIRQGCMQMYFSHHEVATVQASLHNSKFVIDLHYGISPHFHRPEMRQATLGSQFNHDRGNQLVTEATNWFFHLDCDPLWDRLDTIAMGDTNVQTFGPEDSLLIACIQGIKENWRTLRRVCDMAAIIGANPGMDWDSVLAQVSALRCESKFLLSLQLAHGVLGTPLPNGISEMIKSRPILRSLSIETRRRFFVSQTKTEREEFRFCAGLLTLDGFRDRVNYWFFVVRSLKTQGQPKCARSNFFSFLRKLFREIGISTGRRMGFGEKP